MIYKQNNILTFFMTFKGFCAFIGRFAPYFLLFSRFTVAFSAHRAVGATTATGGFSSFVIFDHPKNNCCYNQNQNR
jgi:hypothetical protein